MREVIGLTLAGIAAVAAVLTVRELPPWLPMPSGEILAALFKLAIALLGAWLAIVIWGIRRRLDGQAATHTANDARLKSVEADLVAVKSEVALKDLKTNWFTAAFCGRGMMLGASPLGHSVQRIRVPLSDIRCLPATKSFIQISRAIGLEAPAG